MVLAVVELVTAIRPTRSSLLGHAHIPRSPVAMYFTEKTDAEEDGLLVLI